MSTLHNYIKNRDFFGLIKNIKNSSLYKLDESKKAAISLCIEENLDRFALFLSYYGAILDEKETGKYMNILITKKSNLLLSILISINIDKSVNLIKDILQPCIRVAILQNNYSALTQLIAEDVMDTSSPYIHKAIIKRDIISIHLLLFAGANINSLDEKGLTPLFLAAKLGYEEVFKILIYANADTSIICDEKCILHYCDNNLIKYIEKDMNIFIDKQDIEGRTPLHLAMINGNILLVEKLLTMGASINITDIYGKTVANYGLTNKIIDDLQYNPTRNDFIKSCEEQYDNKRLYIVEAKKRLDKNINNINETSFLREVDFESDILWRFIDYPGGERELFTRYAVYTTILEERIKIMQNYISEMKVLIQMQLFVQ